MIFYTDKGRETALAEIHRLRVLISEIPGDVLSFGDASSIGFYLEQLSIAIRHEQEERKCST